MRTTKRKNKNGTVVEYYQLAHNERHPVTNKTVARVIHNFGRADDLDRQELVRLCKSVARICGLEVVDSGPRHEENRGVQDGQHVRRLEETVAELQESEETYKMIFESANDEIVYLGPEGTIIEINDKVEDLFGYKREEVIGKNLADLGALSPEDLQKNIEILKDTIGGKPQKMKEVYAYRKDGRRICIEGNARVIRKDGEVKGLLVIIRDITERKRSEKAFQDHRNRLEELVKERTNNLEEANIALKVLLKRREHDKVELEDKIVDNVKELILPFFEKLKQSHLDDRQKVFAEIVEYNLNNIISPFVKELSSKYLGLTPTEIRVANVIKQGKSTKEIAAMLDMSPRTVDIHRYNIRKKLGLNNEKASLATHLMSLK